RMSLLPSPLKSRCPTIAQGLATEPSEPPPITLALLISQFTVWPLLVLYQRISLLLSPLKSCVSTSLLLPAAGNVVAAAHAEAAPAAVRCWNPTAGNDPFAAVGAGAKLRLLVSPVKPWPRQEGAFGVPLLTLVLTTSVDPLLKFAWELQQSPTMLNSAAVQN